MIVVKTSDCEEHKFPTAKNYRFRRFGKRLFLYNSGREVVAIFQTNSIFGFWEE